jgi:hypothetical protein
MVNLSRLPWVTEQLPGTASHTQATVYLTEQKSTSVTGHMPPVETGLDATSADRWKFESGEGTFCHGEFSCFLQS